VNSTSYFTLMSRVIIEFMIASLVALSLQRGHRCCVDLLQMVQKPAEKDLRDISMLDDRGDDEL